MWRIRQFFACLKDEKGIVLVIVIVPAFLSMQF